MNGKFLDLDLGAGDGAVDVDPSILEQIDGLYEEAQRGGSFLGWVRLPEDPSGVREVRSWLKGLKKNPTALCVLGIGGSCLGARAVYDFLQPQREVQFFDNIDGHSYEGRLAKLNLKKCHFLAISKSGETSETLFQLAHVLELLRARHLKASEYVTVITENKKSTLTAVADELELTRLTVPTDVGGRFSVFSTVGLAPLMWAGISANKLFEGAIWARDQKKLISRLVGYYLKSFERGEWISLFWFYVDGLKTFGLWLEQLWAESLAKRIDRSGQGAPRVSTPITCIGATDQHSLLQQFTEGARDKCFLFVRCQESENSRKLKRLSVRALQLAEGHSVGELLGIEASATQKILDDLKIHTGRLTLPSHKPQTIGAMIYLFETVVATLGLCLEINAFDQPGVEAVKRVTLGTLGDARYRDQALNKI